MARRTKEDAEKTRLHLLESALKLFSEKGPAKVTLAEIAREAGATRGAIYWHFKDKNELLTCLWDEAIAPLEKSFDDLVELGSVQPLESLESLISEFLLQLATDTHTRQVFRVLEQSFNMQELNEEHGLVQLRCQWSESLTKFFQPVEKMGFLRDGLTAEIAAFLIMSSVEGLISYHLADERCIQLESNTRLLAQIYMQMVRK
ncbi:TetR family transcriptional regulator [Parendozoicomonas sp. Alg238-R29]|uniref:TetR family transcriptional regulator n=1 Tax=Parendozoicomonas sp. Alg238-R29 TaxID=2993446 RepID=UPI00248F076C|nr:TetR family transcriptional regulator [Parendozoicomonas sp. Alg238-R29]